MEISWTKPPGEDKPNDISHEELAEIVRVALERAHRLQETNFTYEEMLDVGTELGIERSHLEAAAEEIAERREGKRKCRMRKLELVLHIATYGVVMVGLFMINLVASPGEIWIQYPMIGWGIGIGIHAAWVYLDNKSVMMGLGPLDLGTGEEEGKPSAG